VAALNFTISRVSHRAEVEIIKVSHSIEPGSAGREAWACMAGRIRVALPTDGEQILTLTETDGYTVTVRHEAGDALRALNYGLAAIKMAREWVARA
jgi:hypothetical protein